MSRNFLPSNVLPLHLKETFPPIIWIFAEGEGDGIEFWLPFKIFSTLLGNIVRQIGRSFFKKKRNIKVNHSVIKPPLQTDEKNTLIFYYLALSQCTTNFSFPNLLESILCV